MLPASSIRNSLYIAGVVGAVMAAEPPVPVLKVIVAPGVNTDVTAGAKQAVTPLGGLPSVTLPPATLDWLCANTVCWPVGAVLSTFTTALEAADTLPALSMTNKR